MAWYSAPINRIEPGVLQRNDRRIIGELIKRRIIVRSRILLIRRSWPWRSSYCLVTGLIVGRPISLIGGEMKDEIVSLELPNEAASISIIHILHRNLILISEFYNFNNLIHWKLLFYIYRIFYSLIISGNIITQIFFFLVTSFHTLGVSHVFSLNIYGGKRLLNIDFLTPILANSQNWFL